MCPSGEVDLDLVGKMAFRNEVERDEPETTEERDQRGIDAAFHEVVGLQPESKENSEANACKDNTPL